MRKEAKFAVILAGNGVFDGSEIHEATLTLYAIMKHGGSYKIFAPDMDQSDVINHITGEEMSEKRNVLIEAARIARGDIQNLKEFRADDFDGLIMPGGFGAAKNLSSFAFEGSNCSVNEEVENALRAMADQNKPIGALCISPVIVARIFGDLKLTIGQDADTAQAVEKMGAIHQKTDHGEVVVDQKRKVITSPCYMLDANILNIAEGTDNVVQSMLEMMD
ncbi:MAG: isoprenoid biosynthesis glyoxalase ElbB [Bacteroidales bacterium]|nr:isoprenoid biosynthesis glyoxalase ElbB [Bacteroidales bacterium]